MLRGLIGFDVSAQAVARGGSRESPRRSYGGEESPVGKASNGPAVAATAEAVAQQKTDSQPTPCQSHPAQPQERRLKEGHR